MPNCFNLTRKSSPSAGPVPLTKIDEEMCAHFKVDCHPTRWLQMWYDTIGWHLAMGHSFEVVRKKIEEDFKGVLKPDDLLFQICDWLAENFTARAWAEMGKR